MPTQAEVALAEIHRKAYVALVRERKATKPFVGGTFQLLKLEVTVICAGGLADEEIARWLDTKGVDLMQKLDLACEPFREEGSYAISVD